MGPNTQSGSIALWQYWPSCGKQGIPPHSPELVWGLGGHWKSYPQDPKVSACLRGLTSMLSTSPIRSRYTPASIACAYLKPTFPTAAVCMHCEGHSLALRFVDPDPGTVTRFGSRPRDEGTLGGTTVVFSGMDIRVGCLGNRPELDWGLVCTAQCAPRRSRGPAFRIGPCRLSILGFGCAVVGFRGSIVQTR